MTARLQHQDRRCPSRNADRALGLADRLAPPAVRTSSNPLELVWSHPASILLTFAFRTILAPANSILGILLSMAAELGAQVAIAAVCALPTDQRS
jgi:hypothetical protein